MQCHINQQCDFSLKLKKVQNIFGQLLRIKRTLCNRSKITQNYIFKMSKDKKSENSLAHIKSKIKVVFLGDQSTGKTSILLRFMHDKFQTAQAPTVGIDFMAKNILVSGANLRLQLWDTAGQQRFRSLIPSYIKDATVTFIVFDLSNRKSFQNLREWIELCVQNQTERSITVLVGNKSDLQKEREVEQQQIEQFSSHEQMTYFEVSAKTNKNIQQIFKYAAQQYVNKTFGNEVTLGNIQKIHQSLASKMVGLHKQSYQSNNVSLKERQKQDNKDNKKKIGCC